MHLVRLKKIIINRYTKTQIAYTYKPIELKINLKH